MLLRHPVIYADADGASTTALLIREGRIVATGAEAMAAASPADEIVEPEGACVFPALCDAHVHLWGLGLRRGSISLGGAKSAADVYAALSTYDMVQAPGGWVLGRDWDQNRWTERAPLDITRLDVMFGEHPVVLRRVDGHALWVNSAALARAGVSPDWDPGPNGHFGRRPAGDPSGLLVDDAMNPVLEAIPEPTVDEDRGVFLESCRMLQRFGCSSAHVAWVPLDRLKMLTDLHADGELPLRLHVLLDGRDPELERELRQGARYDDWLNIAGVKFFADGALGSQGAHLLDGYRDGTTGLVLETPEHLGERCRALAAAGWQVAIHAIGDAAAGTVLDAYAAMDAADRARTRPRMEHCQMLTGRDVQRFSALGVTASIQAIHMYSDAAWATDQLTDEQLDRLFRWADLLESAPCLAGGSDYPIEDPNPWHAIATAISRLDRLGRPFRAAQALDLRSALRSYTEAAAWTSFREHSSGRLATGCLADFIVLPRDPFESNAREIWDMRVVETWIGGVKAT